MWAVYYIAMLYTYFAVLVCLLHVTNGINGS